MTVKRNPDTTPAVLEEISEAPAPKATTKAAQAKAAPKESEQQIKNRLRNEAEREVLNHHRDEFYRIAEKKFTDAGLVFARRLTDAEKAQQKIEELLKEHPELRSQFTALADVRDEAVNAVAEADEDARESAGEDDLPETPDQVWAGEPDIDESWPAQDASYDLG